MALCAFAALSIGRAAASDGTDMRVDELRASSEAARVVENSEKAAYDHTLASYRRAMLEHPADAALALSACQFSEHFGMSEELTWADAAGKDFDACRETLERQHASDVEVELFLLEHKFGEPAIAFGEPLVPRARNWSSSQQARLHAALARAYAYVKNDERAGQEAVLATQLDPASVQLVPAMRYLARKGDPAAATRLLEAAPLPKFAWAETSRIRTATEILPGNAAIDELHRAQRAGLKIDSYTAARALERTGDAAGADALLSADKASRKIGTPQDRQFRLDVAFAAADAKAAADVISDQYAATKDAGHLVSAYARLLRLDPSLAARADLIPLAWALAGCLFAFVAAPALLVFPVHYRGTVRQRIGKPCVPLFERIGLRHAWLALAILLLALYAVAMLRFGGNTSISPSGSGVGRMGWPKRVAVSHLWTLLFCSIALIPVGRLLSWREWTGSGQWNKRWFLLPAALLGVAAYQWLRHRAAMPPVWSDATWSVALVHGAQSLGGIPLALAIMSVWVPIMEELVFRGCLLGGLSRHLSFGWANILQALLFAGLHHDGQHFVYLAAFGLIAGWLARKTKGLAMPIAFHALNNALFVLMVAAR